MADQDPTNPTRFPTESIPFPRAGQDLQKRPAGDSGGSESSTPPSMDRVVRSAHDTVDQIASKVAPAVDTLRTAAADMGAMQEQWVSSCRTHVRENPLASVVTAAVAGMLLGRLMAR